MQPGSQDARPRSATRRPGPGIGEREPAAPTSLRDPRVRGKRILYVDDDPFLRRATIRLLQGAGASCIAASTHLQAMRLLGRDPDLDLAILDFQMPDGHVARLIERMQCVRPSLLLLGTSGSNRGAEFSEAGVNRFLQKPWRLEELIHAADW